MISLIQKLSIHPKYSKLYSWSKLITITGGAQAIIQAAGLVCGILIIRLLPTQEYAYYTLANTMLGTMTLLSDSGISTGVMAQGGKVWQDKEKFGVVLATGLDLRKKFAIGSLAVAVPLLIYLLLHHGANLLTTLLITLSLIPTFIAALSDSLLEIVPKLHQNITPLQKNQITVSIGRLFLSSVGVFVFPYTFIAILANGIPRIYGNFRLRKIVDNFVDKKQNPSVTIRKEILKIVKRVLPGAIYYCMSGQITIWLISFFGNTKSIAQLGALGRLSMILNLFAVIVSTLFIPRFARLSKDRKILLRRFFQISGGSLLLGICIVSLFSLFPNQILLILGKQYSGLTHELLLNIIGSCITLVWGTIFNLYTSRGWIINPFFAITFSICAILLGVNMFNISSVTGVLYLNVFIAVVELVYHTSFGLYKILIK